METTPGKRVRMFREFKGYKNATAFAEAAGLKVATLSSIETDRTAPSFDILATLIAAFPDLNSDWLLLGVGEMLRPPKGPDPFLPGGVVNSMGATVHRAGGVKQVLGAAFGEDVDKVHQPVPVAQTDREFIDTLLAKIAREVARADRAEANEAKLYHIIAELQDSARFMQEELQDLRGELRGKADGNQVDAPGYPAPQLLPRAFVKGLWRPEESTESSCVVRQLNPALEQPDVLFGDSEKAAA